MIERPDYEQVFTLQKDEGKQIGKYLLTKKIGKGQFGVVWLTIDTETKKKSACKQINRKIIDGSKTLTILLNNETYVMKTINHPNILHLYDHLASHDNYYLILDYCDQGDMINYMNSKGIKIFEEIEAVSLLRQLMNGFIELREHKILHRDLKLANILMNNETLIIGDFGLSKMGEMGETRLGTPFSMAPELYFEDLFGTNYNSKADLWSIGVLFHQLLFEEYPFIGGSLQELEQNIKSTLAKGPLQFNRKISDETCDFLRRILIINPKKRISWEEAFTHPIFEKFPVLSKNKKLLAEKIKKIPRSDDIFFSIEYVSDLGLFKSIDSQKENSLSLSYKKIIFDKSIVREVSYIYFHQLNIIYFQIHAVKVIIKNIKSRKFHFFDQPLMNLCVLITLKGMFLSKSLKTNLTNNTNSLNLGPNSFQKFNESTERVNIINIVTELYLGLRKHYELNLKRITKNNLKDFYSKEVSNNVLNHQITNQKIEEQADIILCSKGKGMGEDYLHDYFSMCANIMIVIKSSKFFVYIDSKKNENQKFNWLSFYNLLNRGKTESLKRMSAM